MINNEYIKNTFKSAFIMYKSDILEMNTFIRNYLRDNNINMEDDMVSSSDKPTNDGKPTRFSDGASAETEDD